jgi:hypothetical protein
MNKSNKVKSIFSNVSLPPFFGDNFRTNGPEWRRVKKVNFELIGRVLACHLIVEHYLTKYLELNTPTDLSWDAAKLSFSQKIALACGKDSPICNNNLHEGILTLNRIRNDFSHNIEVALDSKKIDNLKKILKAFSIKSEDSAKYSDVAIVEIFTMMACSYFAGYCSCKYSKKDETKKINNNRGAKNKEVLACNRQTTGQS